MLDKPPLPGGLRLITNVFTSWDGRWYLEIVRHGYPRSVPPDITFNQLEARAAFFPLFPTLVRFVDPVIPGGDTIAALFVNLVLGAVVIWLVGLLARGWWGDRVAGRAMVLMSVFPASVVLTMAYSETILLALAAGCLLALDRRRWLLAGTLAAFATAARPNGVALCAACAVACGDRDRATAGVAFTDRSAAVADRFRRFPDLDRASMPAKPGCGGGCSARRGRRAPRSG